LLLMLTLFKLLFIFFSFYSFVWTQDESEAKEDSEVTDTDDEDPENQQQQQQQYRSYYSPPHVDVATEFIFPRYGDRRLPLGEWIEVLVGFTNKGSASKTFNVTYIYGSLRFSQDPNVILQNFSYIHHGEIVRPKRSVSFPWWFMPDSLLEPRDYFLSVSVDYSDEDNLNYTQLFFNDTIYMVDDSEIDLTYVFTYFLIFAIAVLVFYFVSTKSGSTSTIISNIQTTIGAKAEVQKISTVNVGSLDSWGSNQQIDSFKKIQEKEKKRKQQEAQQKAAKKKKNEAQNKK